MLKAGGSIWCSTYARYAAWLCPPKGPDRKVLLATLSALESEGLIESDQALHGNRLGDQTWQLTEKGSSLVEGTGHRV